MAQEKVVVVAGAHQGGARRRFAAGGRGVAMPVRSKVHADAFAAKIEGAQGYA